MSRRQFIRLSTLGALVFTPFRSFAKASNSQPADDLTKLRDELTKLIKQQLIDSPPNVPLGTILPYAGSLTLPNEIPENWKFCNGEELPRDGEYNLLFQKIGNAWGTPLDNTKFKLPDLRGQFLRGVDRGANVDKEPTRQIGSYQPDSTRRPTNPFSTNTKGNHNHGGRTGPIEFMKWHGAGEDRTAPWGRDFVGVNSVRATIDLDGNHAHSITEGGDAETRPVNAAVNWLIRVK